MLNILISVVLLNVSVLGFFFTFNLNKVENTFSGITATYISDSVYLNNYTNKYYFDKDDIVQKTIYYFKENLGDLEHNLTFWFREDELNTEVSDYPNIVQIEVAAKVLFDAKYVKNVRFYLDGRKVSKDWFAAL